MRPAASLSFAAGVLAGVPLTHTHAHTRPQTRALPRDLTGYQGSKPSGVTKYLVMAVAVNLDGVDTASFCIFLCGPPPLASPSPTPGRFSFPARGIKQAEIRGGEEDRPWLVHSSGRRADRVPYRTHTGDTTISARRISASDPLIQHQTKGRDVTEHAEFDTGAHRLRSLFPALVRRDEMLWLVSTLRMVGTSF